uniref:FAS1-like dehydratase domain-containing protein n=1 Tax=Melanopsichium pennsylvanicum 4 TaxID=1398559 RepID=A0A077R687_9BASI|nr:conserved hypothetical protein [Melanopsichium pennsylvanicum 4]
MSRLAPAQRLMRSSMPFSKLKAATCSKVVTPISYSRNISTTGPALSSSSTSLEKWIQAVQSQTKTLHDTADLNKARQLLLVLPNLSSSLVTSSRNLLEKHTGEDAMSLSPGSPMPFGAELVLFNPLLSECTLGSDGTERTFGPPGGLDQRMWASGSFEFEKGKRLKMGQDVTCKVAVESVQPKEGAKTGKMVLVTRKLRYENDEGLVMTERRCHVYRKQKPAEERRYRAPVASNAPKASEGQCK